MKKYKNTDVLKFGKYKGKTIDYLLNNNGDYIDWCFKNVPNFSITNNFDVYKSEYNNNNEKIELNIKELNIKELIDIININEKKNKILENILWKYQKNEPVIYDKINKKYYNRRLECIKNDINNFKGYSIGILESNDDGGIIDTFNIYYEETSIKGHTNNILFSNEYIIKTESGTTNHSFNTAYYDTPIILYNIDGMINVFQSGGLNMKNWGNSLSSYSYRHHGSNDEPRYGYGTKVIF